MKGARLLRTGGLALLGLLAFWAVVVLYWRVSGTSPTAGHLLVYLFLLPLVLVGGWLLMRWMVRRTRARRATMPPQAGAAGGDDPGPDDGPQPDRVLHLLASTAWLRAGYGGDAIAQALVQPQRPPLHPGLKDQLGLPVFAADVEGLDPTMMEAPLDAVLAAAGGDGSAGKVFGGERLRAMALLDAVAEELLFAALPLSPVDAAAVEPANHGLHPHAMHHSRSSRAAAPAAAPAVLRIRVLLPAAWPASARAACGAWLGDKARAVGFDGGQFDIEAMAVNSAAEVWRLLEQLSRMQAGEAGHDTHLLLAAHSSIGEASIDRLDARRELLVSGHPEGLIPGEGAAGLLFAGRPPVVAELDDAAATATPLRLHRLLHGKAAQGRGAGRQAAALLEAALKTAGRSAEDIALVFSDADHRPSRSIEIASAISAALPELEPVDSARHLGLACGDLGPVAPLALLATAAAQVAADQAPILAMSLADREARIALVLSPEPAMADEPAGGKDPHSRTPAAAAAIA